MNTKKIVTLLKREWWENKAQFIRGPLVILVISAVMVCVGLAFMNYHGVKVTGGSLEEISKSCGENTCVLENGNIRVNFQKVLENDPKVVGYTVLQFLYANCFFISISVSIMLSIYALKSLFDDRVKKDILFWRSLPFTEAENVLAKAVTLLVSFPVVVFLSNLVATFVALVLAIFWGSYFGLNLSAIFGAIDFKLLVSVPFVVLRDNLVGMLCLLPIIGYALFCSAWAKKSPALPAFLIPVGLVLCSTVIASVVGTDPLIRPIFGWYFEFLQKTSATFVLKSPLNFAADMVLPLLMSIGIGVVFMAAAVWLRDNRYEI